MKPAFFSICMGCILAALPLTPVFAQTTSPPSAGSLSLNGEDFTVQLLSGTGTLNSDQVSASSADTLYGNVGASQFASGIDSNAYASTQYGSASASTQGYSIDVGAQATKGLSFAQASYQQSYTAAPGALFEISIPYSVSLAGNINADASISTTVNDPNGGRLSLTDQEGFETLGPKITDSGYLDLVIRNTSNTPQQYLFVVDADVESTPSVSTVPEPQPYLLLLSGLGIMVLAVRRKDAAQGRGQ